MEASGSNSDAYGTTGGGGGEGGGGGGLAFTPNNHVNNTSTHSRRNSSTNRMHLSASRILRSPLSALLEYSGILRPRSSHLDSDSPLLNSSSPAHSHAYHDHLHSRLAAPSAHPPNFSATAAAAAAHPGEVSIRIITSAEQGLDVIASPLPSAVASANLLRDVNAQTRSSVQPISRSRSAASLEGQSDGELGGPDAAAQSTFTSLDPEAADGVGTESRNSPYQRYDIQQAARWIESILPFSLLLLIVFIRLHLQGFFVTIWIAAVLFKSNDILKKQTALKGERRISVLAGISLVFMLHVFGVYWLFWKDDLLYPLVMLPPRAIPPFWHAIFIIMVNDTLVRQTAMVVKCILLMYYKNSRGQGYRKQGQLLTLVEYSLILYRGLLPAPVWYRFFLNKEYGSLFSSLVTGLYLTFKLTSVVEKVQFVFTALKALSCKEIHYGDYATSEQVNAAGDLCAICQEKMHVPILLRCNHIFCEDCVSEWFERERTCPLCRALVKAADLRSFGDGSTNLFFQLF